MFDQSSMAALIRGAVLSGVALVWIVAIVRLIGVRALSKMTAFDFVITLASGSLLATAGTASEPAAFLQAVAALTTLLCLQYLLAWSRSHVRPFRRLVDNRPLLVVRDGEIDPDGLRRSRMTPDDVRSKVRQAGIADMADVSALIVEATGDVSIVAGGTPSARLMDSVRDPDGTGTT